MIKYLVKLVSNEKYADDLLQGSLFMNAAGYFHYLEKGQGDECEAGISSEVKIYKGSRFPIYCMYIIEEGDIFNKNTLIINQECINKLQCQNGWAVVIPYHKFEYLLETYQLETNGYALYWGKVDYRRKTFSDTKRYLSGNGIDNVFIKNPDYSYQKEFRIVLPQNCKIEPFKEYIDGDYVEVLSEKSYKPVICRFKNELCHIAEKYSLNGIKMDGKYAYLQISNKLVDL